jgi:drug/metabolite transporter (DMT)-like permease
MRPASPVLRGIVYFLLYTLTFVVGMAASKLLMERYSFWQVTFLRLSIPWLVVLGWVARTPDFRPWKSARWKKHLLRGFVGFIGLLLIYLSVKLLPLSLAMTLRQVESFFWVGLAAVFYGEKSSRRQWAALAIGFIGVVLVMRPAMEIDMLGAFVALAAALTNSFMRVLSRDLSRTEDSKTIIFYNFTQWTLLSAFTLPWSWSPVAALDWLPVLGVGILILVSQWLMTESMGLVPAPRLAPWRNSEIFWAGLLGWLVWQEPISPWFVGGSALIIFGGLAASCGGRKVAISLEGQSL